MPNDVGQPRPGQSSSRNQTTPIRHRNLRQIAARPDVYSGPSSPPAAHGSMRPSKAARTARPNVASPSPPSGPKEKGLSLRHMPLDRAAVIEEASMQLANWDQLATTAMARGESIPQTRMHLTQKIIRATDPNQALHDPSGPSSSAFGAYTPRFHDPPPADADAPVGGNAPNHSGAKKDARRREEARAQYLGRNSDDSEHGEGWQEVLGVAWEDLKEFERFGTPVFPGRQADSEEPRIHGYAPSGRSRPSTPSSRTSSRRSEPPLSSPQPKQE